MNQLSDSVREHEYRIEILKLLCEISQSLQNLVNIEEEKLELYRGYKEFIDAEKEIERIKEKWKPNL